MIISNINSDINSYLPAIVRECIEQTKKVEHPSTFPSKLVIKKDKVFINFEYSSLRNSLNCDYEYHNEFVDIHIVLDGEEKLYYYNKESADIRLEQVSFDTERDIGFIHVNEGLFGNQSIILKPNDLVVFFPGELHKPLCSVDDCTEVKKIVVKIHRSLL